MSDVGKAETPRSSPAPMTRETNEALHNLMRHLSNAIADPVLCESIALQIQELIQAEIAAQK